MKRHKKAITAASIMAAAIFVIAILYMLIGNPIIFRNNRSLKKAVQSIRAETVTLNDIVPFAWDTVYTFEPYASKAEIEKIIGFSSSDVKENSVNEGMVHLLFVKGDTVTASILGYADNLGYRIDFSSKVTFAEKATFDVEKRNGITILKKSAVSETVVSQPEQIDETSEGSRLWSKQELSQLFARRAQEQDQLIDCVVISDGAFNLAGAVLFTEASLTVGFIDQDGDMQQAGIDEVAVCDPADFTYLGNGAVSFLTKTESGEVYRQTVTFSRKETGIAFQLNSEPVLDN